MKYNQLTLFDVTVYKIKRTVRRTAQAINQTIQQAHYQTNIFLEGLKQLAPNAFVTLAEAFKSKEDNETFSLKKAALKFFLKPLRDGRRREKIKKQEFYSLPDAWFSDLQLQF